MSKIIKQGATELHSEATSGGDQSVSTQIPYMVEFEITGASPILFHRWDDQAVAAKAGAKKGSTEKKTDNVESYLYRLENGNIGLPGEYIRMSIISAAKFRQDPRSPRKSAMDLYKASIVPMTTLADLGVKDYIEDRRRVVVQRAGITRTRPMLREGWVANFVFIVLSSEYISPQDFYSVLSNAGALIGVGNYRPSFGRFAITSYKVVDLED